MDTFRVVLEGRCLEGFSAEAVKTGLSRLMRVAEEVVDEILQGRDTTVKTGLNQATGDHYVAALRAVGAACRLEQENLHFDVPSRAGFSKTNPASDTEYPLGNSSAPIAPLAQSSAIPSAAAEYVSAAIEPKHRTLGGGGVSGIPASKQHFLAKPAFRNILWLVTCALVLFAASYVPWFHLPEFAGRAAVVGLLSAAVAFVLRKLGWLSRYALWLGGATVGVVLSAGALKETAYKIALQNAGPSDLSSRAIEFASFIGLDASRCTLVMASREMFDVIFTDAVGLVVISLLWAVSKAFKSRNIVIEYFEALLFCIVIELGVWSSVGALGLLTAIAIGASSICIAAYFLRTKSQAIKFVQKPYG